VDSFAKDYADRPLFLDQQRSTMAELIIKKIGISASAVRPSLFLVDRRVLTSSVIESLLSLIPMKSYETDLQVKLCILILILILIPFFDQTFVTNFEKSECELSRAEQFLRNILQIKGVRERLELFLMCYDMEERMRETKEMAELLSKCFHVRFVIFCFCFEKF
jgi:hypothetical protein